MVSAYEKAIKRLWTAKCDITIREYEEDPVELVMKVQYKTPIQNEPCRISYQGISPVGEGVAAEVPQEIKLFIDSKLDIPAGSKITVTQNGVTRDYQRSGLSAVYSVHQEILLELFQKWA